MKKILALIICLVPLRGYTASLHEGGAYRNKQGQILYISSVTTDASGALDIRDQNNVRRKSYEFEGAEELHVSKDIAEPLVTGGVTIERLAFTISSMAETNHILAVGYRQHGQMVVLHGPFTKDRFGYEELIHRIRTAEAQQRLEIGWSVLYPLVNSMIVNPATSEPLKETLMGIIRAMHGRKIVPPTFEVWESAAIGLLSVEPTYKPVIDLIHGFINGTCGKGIPRERSAEMPVPVS